MKTDTTKATHLMDASAFDNLDGEKFLGLNILKIEKGQAAGPFILTEVLRDQNLNKKKKLKKGEKPKLINVYVGQFNKTSMRMPASASFTMKADENKLAVGDTYAIKRVEDYPNPNGGKDGQGYELIIIERAKKK